MAFMLDTILRLSLLLATGFLFGIIMLAYLRIRNKRLLFIAIGFAIFLIHALLYMPEIMFKEYTFTFTDNLHIAFNLFALTFITIGILREEQ
jgi:hypothetical protein